MRSIFTARPAYAAGGGHHPHARELEEISKLLETQPRAARLVHQDLTRHGLINESRGRSGMSAEQVLRAAILRQIEGLSYRDLAFWMADSTTCRTFCRFDDPDDVPARSTLHRNIKALSISTLQMIHRLVVLGAQREGVEDGKTIRVDCSTVKASIHAPTDSTLLWDTVRVLARLMKQARPWSDVRWTDRQRQSKRRTVAIQHAARAEARRPLYRDLLRATEHTLADAERVARSLEDARRDEEPIARAVGLARQIRHHVRLGRSVVKQTRRRIELDEAVPPADKLVSIFEPDTDIIVKDRRETLYGHKVRFSFGASGLVTGMRILDGNPADSTLAVDAAKQNKQLYGKAPESICFDGAFASKRNLADIKALGVQNVVFSKRRGIAIEEMTDSVQTYRKLRNFRAGAEANISFLKRALGLARCLWRSLSSFHSYVWLGVIAANLLTIARALSA
ncbi:MAG: ISNCY family transposase [Polyangiaceae bacterium]